MSRQEKEQYNKYRENSQIVTGCITNDYTGTRRHECRYCPHDKDRAGCYFNRMEWTKLEPIK